MWAISELLTNKGCCREPVEGAPLIVSPVTFNEPLLNPPAPTYQDLLKAFYGITTRDYRLNLAEYIGGSRYPIYTSEVLRILIIYSLEYPIKSN